MRNLFTSFLIYAFAAQAAFGAAITDNTLSVGKSATGNKTFQFNRGSGNGKPGVRWNETSGALEFTNNGTDYLKMGSGGGGTGVNQIQDNNFDAEGGTSGWTASGGTFASSTTNPFNGTRSFTWTANALSQTLFSTAKATPVGFVGRKCQAHIPYYIYTGTAGDYNLQVVDGSANVLVDYPVPVTTGSNTAPLFLTFDCAASGTTVKVGFIAKVASPGQIKFDDVFLGQGRSVLLGGVYLTEWKTYTPTISGFGTPTGVEFLSRRVGDTLEIQGTFTSGTATATIASITLGYDGQNGNVVGATGKIIVGGQVGGAGYFSVPGAAAFVTIPVPGQNYFAIGLQNATVGGFAGLNGNQVMSSGQRVSFQVSVPIQGWTADRLPVEGNTMETSGWRVDANIAGGNINLGTANVSSYSGPSNPSLTLVNNVGMGTIPAQIPCDSTVASSGTTCSGANEVPGIVFNVPTAGDVKVCANFTWQGTSTGGLAAAFQLVETPNNAQTILQEGKTRVDAYSTSTAAEHPFRLCGNFTFTSAGQKTIRLFYEQEGSGSVTGSSIMGDAAATVGQRDIHFEAYPLNQGMPAPVFPEFRNKMNAGAPNIVTYTANVMSTSGPSCAVNFQTGGWLTGGCTRNGAGDVTWTIAAGAFANSSYSCSFMVASHGDDSTESVKYVSKSTTALRLKLNRIYTSPGIADDGTYDISCTGTK